MKSFNRKLEEIRRVGDELERDKQEIARQIRRMSPSAAKNALIARCLSDLHMDRSDFGPVPKQARADWTPQQWIALSIDLKAEARIWSRDGRFDKAAECERLARKAEEHSKRSASRQAVAAAPVSSGRR